MKTSQSWTHQGLACARTSALRAVLTLALLLALPTPYSLAKDGEAAAEAQRAGQTHADLNAQGIELYQGGKYREAVELFLGAYAVDKDPNTLFNIARCYELLNEPEAALRKYEAFLASPDIEPEGRERAARAVQALRQPKETAGDTPHAAPAPATPSPAAPSGEPAAQHAARDKKVLIGWIATGALVAAAAVTGGLTLKAAQDLKTARGAFPADAGDLDQDAKKTTQLSITTDVLGGAAIVMAALSVYWTVKSSAKGRELKVSAGAGHLKLHGTF